MNADFWNYLRHLSVQDKKTLSQKALKTCEEVGELARVILPFDGAYATNHRFTTKEAILEEAIDTVFCALSIAYHLDCSDDEIMDMMILKADKWARLQENEEGLKFPVPYEIHVTVKVPETATPAWMDFYKEQCAQLNVKPIVLDLAGSNGNIRDVMTSSKHFGNNGTAYMELQRITIGLTLADFEVVREKIETVPWHPAAPRKEGDKMPKNCYFEAHIGVRIHPDFREFLTEVAKKLTCHLSRNAFKKHDDGTETVMMTYRTYEGTRNQFEEYVTHIMESLNVSFAMVDPKAMKEFSIFDTKVSHDAAWLKGS